MKKIKQGSVLGIICPSFRQTNNEAVADFLQLIEANGFHYKTGSSLYAEDGYLAGSDELRANDLMAMFQDDEVDAILCYKGGYGASRIVDKLDYDIIKQHPKLLVGFSDVTVLLNAIFQKTKIPTLHGEMGCCLTGLDNSAFSVQHLFKSLLGEVNRTLTKDLSQAPVTLVPGQSSGIIVGGNLSLIVNLMGTPFEIDYQDKILLIEDVEEEPYAIDRMLANLRLAGVFQKIRGCIIGKFTDCKPSDSRIDCQSVDQVLKEYFGNLKIPVLVNFATGHEKPFINVPIGLLAHLNATTKEVTILEPYRWAKC